MNMSKHVLQNKVNTRCETHLLTAEELDMMTDFADTDETAQYFCAKRNMVGIHLPKFDSASDRELLDLFLALDKAKGEWAQSVSKALADGMIDPGEFERIDREFREYCGAAAEVMSRLKFMVQERHAFLSVKATVSFVSSSSKVSGTLKSSGSRVSKVSKSRLISRQGKFEYFVEVYPPPDTASE